MGMFLIALGNPGLEGAGRQEGTCDGATGSAGWVGTRRAAAAAQTCTGL